MLKKCITIITLFLLTSCSGVDVSQYANNTPLLDLHDYFKGQTKGWGIVQDRKGNVTRQFVVDILGTTDDAGNLVLEEDFVWSDGEISRRVWTIARTNQHTYEGQAADVVGQAGGLAFGNALNWSYDLQLEIDGSQWIIHFDDWMFLQPDGVLLNRAEMSKFGIRVGDVTISFSKKF
ncbi:MAG: DUF3833 domain-containing protein [Desulfobacterales bacterium]|nr:DUF3833 domain-containing protein [Deltaproteobacteria bacterium]NNK93528.1 DUF3833 domain-containing protein [Desulfobacterales bacterium]